MPSERNQNQEVDFSKIQEGTKVEYKPVGTAMQTTVGIVKKVMTHDETVGSTNKNIKADDEHPRYLIENMNTRKETAYKQENIMRIVDDDASSSTSEDQ